MKSDMSGVDLEESLAPVEITVQFSDGAQRTAVVAAAEANALRVNGRPLQPRSRWAHLRAAPRKVLLVVLAGWFASVVIPAFVQQWQDRSKELDLKNGLVTKISDATAEAVTGSHLIAANLLPEAQDAAVKWDRLLLEEERGKAGKGKAREITAIERQKITKAQQEFDTARTGERRAEQAFYNGVRNTWIKSGGSIDAQLSTYFGAKLPERWREYHEVVLAYVQLASNVQGARRQQFETLVSQYLCRHMDDPLKEVEGECDPGRVIDVNENYTSVGDSLLLSREGVLGPIIDANASGYSAGARDFFHAVTLQLF